ncbi:MAG: hypothetical protein R2939_13440 [Kofleriaceae bacterium]
MRRAAVAVAAAVAAVAGSGSWVTVPVAGVAAVGLTGCGPSCGNGEVEGDEQCDDGNDDQSDECRGCRYFAPPRTTIKWSFNDRPDLGFSGDGCLDVGAAKVLVELSGPTSTSTESECGTKQVVYDDLPPGTYTVALTPKASTGASLVTEPYLAEVIATTSDVTVEVVVPHTAWTTAYTGTFFFRVTWGGEACAAASPPVVSQLLTMTVGGDPVTQLTDSGQALDGTDEGPCRPSTDQFPQSILAVPFGPASMTIEGRDAGGTTVFLETFPTFVGAGISNPTRTFAIAGPDPVDAMPPDAPLPDAGS